MIKINKSQFVKLFENDITISKIGMIDMEVIENNTYYSLYYKFPLIEKLVLEIYKCIPGANIEKYEQGIMKTVNSIITNNKSFDIIPDYLIEKIKKYFDEDDNSPRNIVFHDFGTENKKVTVDFEEINYIIAVLLALLTHISKQYNLATLKKIEIIQN